ncbi:MAG: hypothetical protein K0S76_2585 [Herbinix sp.]|jgi:hypothetical protein|nr:hypothetical protein [Herbinix sp.]
MSKIILGFVLHDRVQTASRVQELLSKYGCEINTRLGLHVASPESCSPQGLILLEFVDNAEEAVAGFEEELKEIADVDIQKMEF